MRLKPRRRDLPWKAAAAATMGTVCSAQELTTARAALLSTGHPELDSAALRKAWLELHESWLIAKSAEIGIRAGGGFAIIGLGGMGRCELLPYSDLDLMLLHDNMPIEAVEQVADMLWYPLWDANIRLDHSVRTVAETLRIADTDMTAGLAMLEARHITGDELLSTTLVDGVRRQWRSGIRSRVGDLAELTHARWQRCGRIAHRAEPDLKSGWGGLRDVQLLNALAAAQLVDRHGVRNPDMPAGSLDDAYRTLLDVRTELHRVSGRSRDLLQPQYADEIGAALGAGDRFDLARVVSDAGRTISYHAEAGLRTAVNALPRRGVSAWRHRPKRRPLGEGVVEFAGEVVLARSDRLGGAGVRPERDPGLVLRVAAAAATTGLPISAATLGRLVDTVPEMPQPWPRQALDDLLVLLSAGPATVSTIEALDRTGLWGRLLPEWRAVRDLPPRDIAHTWTVDRHLVETTVQAAALTTRVARPDVLALGALLHDIGKGRGADHSVIGAELATVIGTRLGLPACDVAMLEKLVRYHLLLPMLATRRDLNDPRTIATVSEALDGDPMLLDVLHALTEADALATGPGVWGDWKASLVGELVRRCHTAMAGAPLPIVDATQPEYLFLEAGHDVHVEVTPGDGPHLYEVVMIVPNERGVLSNAAGVLALNSLRVHSAAAHTHEGAGVIEFVVSPLFGSPAAAELLRQQLISALAGDLDVVGVLEERDRDAAQAAPGRAGEVLIGVPFARSTAPPRILWFDTATAGQLIVEVRAGDRPGLLARLTRALERAGADIIWAKVNTFGSAVDDVFCVVLPTEPAAVDAVEKQLLAALPVVHEPDAHCART